MQAHVTKLERYFDRITGCRVTVEAPGHHHHKGGAFHVRIDVTVPGEEIVVGQEHAHPDTHQDVYVAVEDAFAAAVRQVKAHADRQRGHHGHQPRGG